MEHKSCGDGSSVRMSEMGEGGGEKVVVVVVVAAVDAGRRGMRRQR